MQDSIVLITGRDRNNRFGTGFVFRQAGGCAYVLTCAHVVSGLEQILVDEISATVIASGEDSGIDLAVLRVEGLSNKECLTLGGPGDKGRAFCARGFRGYDKNYRSQSLRGVLGESVEITPKGQFNLSQAWDLTLTEGSLQQGCSGSPVLDEFSGHVLGLISHREGNDTGLAISIEAIAHIWQFVDSQQLYQDLLGLGYDPQVDLFADLMDVAAVGAFLVHGASPEYGQQWLVNRLVHQFMPQGLTAGKKIRIEVNRLGRRSDANALWREMGGRVGLGGRAASPTEIIDRICKWWQTQDVILVLHDVDSLPDSVLGELLDQFWKPLARQARSLQFQTQFRLLLFLVDNGGSTANRVALFVDQLDDSWQPEIPLRAPKIVEFSDKNLKDWIRSRYTRLPQTLTQNVSRTVQAILETTDNGIPVPTLKEICYRCDCDWYDELLPCLKL